MSWKKFNLKAFHAHDTGFYWSSENALHEHFIASSGVWVWMKMLLYSSSQSDKRTLAFKYEFSWNHWDFHLGSHNWPFTPCVPPPHLSGSPFDPLCKHLVLIISFSFVFHSVSCKHYAQCCDGINEESSNHLKDLLRKYFQAENANTDRNDVAWEWITPDTRRVCIHRRRVLLVRAVVEGVWGWRGVELSYCWLGIQLSPQTLVEEVSPSRHGEWITPDTNSELQFKHIMTLL